VTSTSEVAQAISLSNPGVGEFGDARSWTVNPLRFFGCHLDLEGQDGRGLLEPRNRPDPLGGRFLWMQSSGFRSLAQPPRGVSPRKPRNGFLESSFPAAFSFPGKNARCGCVHQDMTLKPASGPICYPNPGRFSYRLDEGRRSRRLPRPSLRSRNNPETILPSPGPQCRAVAGSFPGCNHGLAVDVNNCAECQRIWYSHRAKTQWKQIRNLPVDVDPAEGKFSGSGRLSSVVRWTSAAEWLHGMRRFAAGDSALKNETVTEEEKPL
jgi:hypothetical protein